MAVIDAIPGLKVCVRVDGEPLDEHEETPDDNNDTDKKVTRYVVAQPGKHFAVNFKTTNEFRRNKRQWDLSIHLKLDGKPAISTLAWAKWGAYSHTFDYAEESKGDGRWLQHKLLFSDLVFGW